MKLLILTQKVDKNDDGLGFFHAWIEGFAGRVEQVTVICLQKGPFSLSANVRVFSLGKEIQPARSWPRFRYAINFYKLIFRERKTYDAVFVHMNQEYVLLGGIFWRLAGKKIVLWRNHPMGGFLTAVAVFLSNKVFCTSPYSYTARFKKTAVMPVGIDTDAFRPEASARKNAILFFGRVSPVKRPDVLIDAIRILKEKGVVAQADIVGPINEVDKAFAEKMKAKIQAADLGSQIHFLPPVMPAAVSNLLRSYKVYVNTTPTGSMDKTIFETMASETLVAVSNKALVGQIPDQFIFKEDDPADLARVLENLLHMPDSDARSNGTILRQYVVTHHGLTILIEKLIHEFSRP